MYTPWGYSQRPGNIPGSIRKSGGGGLCSSSASSLLLSNLRSEGADVTSEDTPEYLQRFHFAHLHSTHALAPYFPAPRPAAQGKMEEGVDRGVVRSDGSVDEDRENLVHVPCSPEQGFRFRVLGCGSPSCLHVPCDMRHRSPRHCLAWNRFHSVWNTAPVACGGRECTGSREEVSSPQPPTTKPSQAIDIVTRLRAPLRCQDRCGTALDCVPRAG